MMDDMESNQISVSLSLDKDVDKNTAYKTANEVTNAILKLRELIVGAMDGNATATSGLTGGSTDNYSNFTFQIITDDDITSTSQFRKIIKKIENNTKNIKCENLTVSSSAMGSMSQMMNQGIEVRIYGDDQQKLLKTSNQIMKLITSVKGTENVDNGVTAQDKQLHLKINKNKAADDGLTVAQIYQQLAEKITTEKLQLQLPKGKRL